MIVIPNNKSQKFEFLPRHYYIPSITSETNSYKQIMQ